MTPSESTLATLCTAAALPEPDALAAMNHVLIVLAPGASEAGNIPDHPLLQATLARRRLDPDELDSEPVSANTASGALRVWLMLDPEKSTFDNQTLLRDGLAVLLDEEPAGIDVLIVADAGERAWMAGLAAYVALANGAPLPSRKQKDAPQPLESLRIWGVDAEPRDALGLAEGNLLARTLTALPPNALTPAVYRSRIAALAGELGWQVEEFDLPRLQAMGAGAFVAVAQGSELADAAIVRVSLIPPAAQGRVALVGKGICFDTGGHNLKSADAMIGMHEDMAGSAVVLGILLAATGKTVWVAEESGIDAITAISGSGPAYVFYLIEALEEAAVHLGFDAATAKMLALETFAGALALAESSPESVATLRARVTSPGGTTERAIASFDAAQLKAVIGVGVNACQARSVELGELLAKG